jgi:hypothetical protein
MELNLVIGLVVVMIVGFFAYQWYSASNRKSVAAARKPAPAAVANAMTATMNPTLAAATPAPPEEEKYPVVAGQTEAEMRAKEPVQRRVAPSQQVPVSDDGALGPSQFEENLRHPEQAFHQPANPVPSMSMNEVESGRAGIASAPMGGHQQGFSPEMAQNGGAIVGSSVFAYDGMEPTGFAAF